MGIVAVVIGVVLVAIIAGAGLMLATQGSKASPGPSKPIAGASSSAAAGQTSSDATAGPDDTGVPVATEAASSGPDLGGAVTALSDINSYQFSMTLLGGEFSSELGALGEGGAGDGPITISGTVVVLPEPGADFSFLGLHLIEIGGYDYIDLGTGTFYKTAASGASLADSMSPATMFSSMMDPSLAGDLDFVGKETKNGVPAIHYVATDAALADFGSESGISGATWSCDMWLADQGGYPVSLSVIGTSGGTVVYEITFDLMNVNDPGNVVTAPTNVSSF